MIAKLKMSKAIAVKQKVKEEKYNDEWLKSFVGFEDISEEESKRIVKELEMLAEVVCIHFMNTS